MARPRSPRARTIIEPDEPSAIDEAVLADSEKTAIELSEVLDSLAGMTGRDLRLRIYRIPRGSRQWEFCMEVTPPVETAELMSALKEEYGPGDYAIRVMAEGKIKTTRHFSIAGGLKSPKSRSDDSELMPLLVSTLTGKSSETMQMMMAMMQSQAQQAQQQMQMLIAMMNSSQSSQATMITALMGGREKPADLIAAFAPLMAPKSGGFGETVEMIRAIKELLPDNSSINADDDLITTAVKSFGPAVAGILAARAEQPRQPPSQPTLAYQPPPQHALAGPGAIVGKHPLLASIAPDVLFYFSRQADPEFAAEGVFDVLDKAGIKQDAFAPIIAEFSQSANWVDDLAREGIDLRSNPQWAHDFINSLIRLYTEGTEADNGSDDDSERGAGSEANPGDHGPAGAGGVEINTDQIDGG